MTPIAIRLFENPKFGTTHGKGLRRSAVCNTTAEVSEDVALHVNDAKRGITQEWLLPARRCQGSAGKNSPAFLATNHELAQ